MTNQQKTEAKEQASNPKPSAMSTTAECTKQSFPVQPAEVLGATMQQLDELKGEGKKEYGTHSGGTVLTHITYIENWFNWKTDTKAQYFLNENKVSQITLTYDNKTNYVELIEQISVCLGESEQGKLTDSPSLYYAHWYSDGVAFDLQFFGNYTEIYIYPDL